MRICPQGLPAFREAVTSKGKGTSATRRQEETGPEDTGPEEAVNEEPPAVEEKKERKPKRKGKKKRAD